MNRCPTCNQVMPAKQSPGGAVAPDMDAIMLLETGNLTEWERGFIESVKKQKNLSEKQRVCFEKICGKYLGPAKKAEPKTGDPIASFDPDEDVPF